jgi:hypothetical protein
VGHGIGVELRAGVFAVGALLGDRLLWESGLPKRMPEEDNVWKR